jgi:hypothetical protein
MVVQELGLGPSRCSLWLRDLTFEKITLPANARHELARQQTARRRAEERAQEAMKTTKEAARALAKAGLSVRDAGSLLGLTGARVSQILNDTSK